MITRRRSSQASQLVSSAVPVPFEEDELNGCFPRERRLSSLRSGFFQALPTHLRFHHDSYYNERLSMSCPFDPSGEAFRHQPRTLSIPRGSLDWADALKLRSVVQDMVIEEEGAKKWAAPTAGRPYSIDLGIGRGIEIELSKEGSGLPFDLEGSHWDVLASTTDLRPSLCDDSISPVRPTFVHISSLPPIFTQHSPEPAMNPRDLTYVVEPPANDRSHLKRARTTTLADEEGSDDGRAYDEAEDPRPFAYKHEKEQEELDADDSMFSDSADRARSRPRRAPESPDFDVSGTPPLDDGNGSDDYEFNKRIPRTKKNAPPKKNGHPRKRVTPPKKPEGYTPRPPNSWILYRSEKIRLLKSESTGPKKPQSDISKMIGLMWKDESPAVRKWYDEQAELKKLEHGKMYPGYKYAPVRKVKAGVSREPTLPGTGTILPVPRHNLKRVRVTPVAKARPFSASRSPDAEPAYPPPDRHPAHEQARYQYAGRSPRHDFRYQCPEEPPAPAPYEMQQQPVHERPYRPRSNHFVDAGYHRDMQHHHASQIPHRSPPATASGNYSSSSSSLVPDPTYLAVQRPHSSPYPSTYQHIEHPTSAPEPRYLSAHAQAHLPPSPVTWSVYSHESDPGTHPASSSDTHSAHWYPSTPVQAYHTDLPQAPLSAPAASAQFSYAAPAAYSAAPGPNDPVYYSERIKYGIVTASETLGGDAAPPFGYRLDSLFELADMPERRFSRADSIWALQRGADPNSAQGRTGVDMGIMSEPFDQMLDMSRYQHQQHEGKQRQHHQHHQHHHEQHLDRSDGSFVADDGARYLEVKIPSLDPSMAYLQDKLGRVAAMDPDRRVSQPL